MIPQPTPRLTGALRALWRDCEGSAILEFAFVGPMFIALLMGILSIGLTYLTQGGLETAAETAARLVMTGQAQTIKVTGNSTAGMTAANFKTAICSGLTGTNAAGTTVTIPRMLPPFADCNRLSVIVAPASYTQSSQALTYVNGVLQTPFSPTGASGQIMMVQLVYNLPTFANFMGFSMIGGTSGKYTMVATSVFTAETYTCASGQSTC